MHHTALCNMLTEVLLVILVTETRVHSGKCKCAADVGV